MKNQTDTVVVIAVLTTYWPRFSENVTTTSMLVLHTL
jgi:hypothetical protein